MRMKIKGFMFFIFCFCYGQSKTIDGIVAIVEDKQFAILMLVVLATTSLMFLKKGNEQT